MTSYLRMGDRGRETSAKYKLRAAVRVEERPLAFEGARPTYWVIGECGHVMDIVGHAEAHYWEKRIAEGRRHRKRCEHCPKGG